jgi:hypothetical protein
MLIPLSLQEFMKINTSQPLPLQDSTGFASTKQILTALFRGFACLSRFQGEGLPCFSDRQAVDFHFPFFFFLSLEKG